MRTKNFYWSPWTVRIIARSIKFVRARTKSCQFAMQNSERYIAMRWVASCMVWQIVRGFTQDDAHIFCRPDQGKMSSKGNWFSVACFKALGLKNYTAKFRCAIDRTKTNTSVKMNCGIKPSVKSRKLPMKRFEDGSCWRRGCILYFKLDFLWCAMPWTEVGNWGTIQVDYNLPERFELEYIGADNQRHRPVMIHRAPFGSGRFVAVLIEHCGGNFPLWLSPEQIAVLPISERFNDYAQKVIEALKLERHPWFCWWPRWKDRS